MSTALGNTGQSQAPHTPPHNFEAEQGLLGAVLTNNAAYHRVSDFLKPEHFADPVHGRVYEACARLIERGQRADPVTLKGLFDRDGALADIGGAQYLVKLSAAVVNIVSATDYGRTVFDLWIRRALLIEGMRLADYAANLDRLVQQGFELNEETLKDWDGRKLLEATERALGEIGQQIDGGANGGPLAMRDIVGPVIAAIDAASRAGEGVLLGLTTGLDDLDRGLVVGLVPATLYILGARPSMGKSELMCGIALANAKRGKPVAIFSLEMSRAQLTQRLLSRMTGAPLDRLIAGTLNMREWDALVAAEAELRELPLYIDDSAGLPVSRLRSRARRLVRQKGVKLILADYLQLIKPAREGREQNRHNDLSEISKALKEIAKEMDVPVVALSQLSRKLEEREDKRPQLQDLRESGAIEEDADVVMFIYREDYYLLRDRPAKRANESDDRFDARQKQWNEHLSRVGGLAEIIIPKQRQGPAPRTVNLRFEAGRGGFKPLTFDDAGAQGDMLGRHDMDDLDRRSGG